MNSNNYNIRYIIVQQNDAGLSQLSARKQSCHYYITAAGKLLTVHELTPPEGAIIIVLANQAADVLAQQHCLSMLKEALLLQHPGARLLEKKEQPPAHAAAA